MSTPPIQTRERRPPACTGWREVHVPKLCEGVVAASAWVYGKIRVISSLNIMQMPDNPAETGLQWHISVSRNGRRPSDVDVLKARRAFHMKAAEEDNHHPGGARHFMLVCDPARRIDCECKETEEVIVDKGGYKWTNPKDPAACRGCAYALMTDGKKPCPLHPTADHDSKQGRLQVLKLRLAEYFKARQTTPELQQLAIILLESLVKAIDTGDTASMLKLSGQLSDAIPLEDFRDLFAPYTPDPVHV